MEGERFFLLNRGELNDRLDPHYHRIISRHRADFAFPLSKIKHLCLVSDGDHSQLPTEHVTDEANGVRYLRAQDLKDGRIISDRPVYVTRDYFDTLPRSHIYPGYFLFSVMASIGSVAVVPDWLKESTANRAVGILIPRNRSIINPHYLSAFFSTGVGVALFEALKKGGLQQRINLSDLGNLQIPLPPIEIQNKIASIQEEGYSNKFHKEVEAQALLDGIDGYLLRQLGLAAQTADARQTFVVSFRQVSGRRFDALAYRPRFAEGSNTHVLTKPLWQLADINSHRVRRPEDGEAIVPYVGLPECDLNEIREVAMRPYMEVKGRSVVKPGDILFARIEPSVFNKKYVLADDLKGFPYAYTSTEFYVVTPKLREVNRDYLYAMFFCSFVFEQVKGKTTGSSGRRRIDSAMFSELQIPLPDDREIQERLAAEVSRRRREAKRLRAEGARDFERAKQEVERIILGEQA